MFKKIACITMSALLIMSLTACGNSGEVDKEIAIPLDGDTKVTYNTAVVDFMDMKNEEKLAATVGYFVSSALSFDVAGTVTDFNGGKNEKCKKGDVIAALDTTNLDFKINEQQIKTNAASSSSSIDYEDAKLELERLQNEREKYFIKAPFDGIISDISRLSIGKQVEANTYVCTVAEPDKIKIASTEGVDGLHFGLDVNVKISSSDYAGNIILSGENAPADASKNAKKTVLVKLTADDEKRLLQEGVGAIDAGWATIYATTIKRNDVLAVPDSAIKTDSNKTYCSVLVGEQKFELPVEAGISCGGFTQIISGLNQGDVVVLSS